ncbi:hypothetical protein C8Q74DRAFT_106105 [Fomes fomentarius]|nr:hypothetical protein C8Q74DRAFT_106105 [Fomes fomentarius]
MPCRASLIFHASSSSSSSESVLPTSAPRPAPSYAHSATAHGPQYFVCLRVRSGFRSPGRANGIWRTLELSVWFLQLPLDPGRGASNSVQGTLRPSYLQRASLPPPPRAHTRHVGFLDAHARRCRFVARAPAVGPCGSLQISTFANIRAHLAARGLLWRRLGCAPYTRRCPSLLGRVGLEALELARDCPVTSFGHHRSSTFMTPLTPAPELHARELVVAKSDFDQRPVSLLQGATYPDVDSIRSHHLSASSRRRDTTIAASQIISPPGGLMRTHLLNRSAGEGDSSYTPS